MHRILVVDDESLIRYSLSAMLQSESVEIRTVASGTEAIAEVHRIFYDVCFLDIHLPDMSGLEILEEIRAVSPGTVSVVISGCENEDEIMKDLRRDREYFIAKPFDLFQVKSFVEHILSRDSHLSFDGSQAGSDDAHPADASAGRQRRHERRVVSKRITCMGMLTAMKEEMQVFSADVVNISEGGLGVIAEYELLPGAMLRFYDQSEACIGIVRWCRREGEKDVYRAGLQFLEKGSSAEGLGHLPTC